jgi:predicted nucleotide-binding protein
MVKKTDTPTYEMTPKLVITKERFQNLLEEQIVKGEEIAKIEVASQQQMGSYGGFVGYSGRRILYDEKQKNVFFDAQSRWDKRNKEILQRSFNAPNNKYFHEYEMIYIPIITTDTDIVAEEKDDIRRKINFMKSIIEDLDLITGIDEGLSPVAKNKQTIDSKRIFIVHGHDELKKQTLARFIEQIGLSPIILHEQVDMGQTIIEKLETNSSDVRAAVILLTSDDIGQGREEKTAHLRARQNVVLELGFFWGKLGRDHVFIIMDDDLEKPGDIDGIIYNKFSGDWKIRLCKFLKQLNVPFDMTRILG